MRPICFVCFALVYLLSAGHGHGLGIDSEGAQRTLHGARKELQSEPWARRWVGLTTPLKVLTMLLLDLNDPAAGWRVSGQMCNAGICRTLPRAGGASTSTMLSTEPFSRRSLLLSVPPLLMPVASHAASQKGADLDFTTSPSGLQWADATPGSGSPFKVGQTVTIDYVMSTTGARYGSKIDSTKDRQAPYSWTLGDGSTILGLEQAILGGDGIPPMLPGGVRRIIVPPRLAYADLAIPIKNSLQVQDCSTGRGPIPPQVAQSAGDMGAGEFQRFKNIYCNANRPYQPALVLDVKLYGKRTS